MSKLKAIFLLLITTLVMGCATQQPQQPKKQQPVAQAPQKESAPAEEKTVHCVEGVSGIFTIRFKKAGLLTKVIFFHNEKPAQVSK